jgi:hypothetical protein
VLDLVSVPGSIHYKVLPGLRRDDLLGAPHVLDGVAPVDMVEWVAVGRGDMTLRPEVLVVGAGPTGLALALEDEWRLVAGYVLALTQLAFWAEAATDPVASFLRGTLARLGAPALPLILRRRQLIAEGVRVLSQLRAGYRGSPLSVEGTPHLPGRLRAGDRMPDAIVTSGGRQVRLHELLARPGVDIPLHRDARELRASAHGQYVSVHRLMNRLAPGSSRSAPTATSGSAAAPSMTSN